MFLLLLSMIIMVCGLVAIIAMSSLEEDLGIGITASISIIALIVWACALADVAEIVYEGGADILKVERYQITHEGDTILMSIEQYDYTEEEKCNHKH